MSKISLKKPEEDKSFSEQSDSQTKSIPEEFQRVHRNHFESNIIGNIHEGMKT